MAIRTVSGTEFDGSCVTLTIAKTPFRVISLSYGDNVETEYVYEIGSQMPEAQTPGQYKPADGKIKMRGSVAREILTHFPQIGAANARTIGVVSYTHPEVGSDSDALHGLRILGLSASVEASAKAMELEFTIKYRWVAWTSKRIVFGNNRGGGVRGRLNL